MGVASRALRVLVFVSLNCLKIIISFRLLLNCLLSNPYSPRGFHRGRARRIERTIVKIILLKCMNENFQPPVLPLSPKAGAPREHFAPALEPMLCQKSLCSFCLLSCLLFKIAMHCFSFSKRASAQKYARPRWLFYKFALHHYSPFIHYCFLGEQSLACRCGKIRASLYGMLY